MNIKKIKERYERLKQWQQKPFDYEFTSNDVHHCNNCGHDFKGNYCPYCSQKAGEGDISWKSVRQSVMDIWGLGSRSLPNTIGQLLLRPGYLISDYISGKRQVSFPPVKMLFIVAVIVVFWIYYLMPLLFGDGFDVYGGATDMINGFTAWNKGHFVWTYFILALIFVVPTWVMFRYAPRHTRHTLPQGFFIQIFLLVLNLIITFIALTPLIFWNYNYYFWVSVVVLLIYLFIAYRQLFGYGIWGTLWRMVFIIGSSIYFISTLAILLFGIDSSAMVNYELTSEYSKYFFAGASLAYSLFILTLGWVINLITTRKNRRQNKSEQASDS